MRKQVLLVMLQLLFCSIVFGQTDDPGCYVFTSATDQTCLGTLSCTYAAGYTASSFRVVCNGWYTITAWTEICEGSNCGHCASCVAIYTSTGTFVGDCTSAVGCPSDCCKACALQLSPGSYQLRVSLRACGQNDIGACCEEHGCKAFGTLTNGILECP